MLVVMIATAVCLHCSFCEWELCEHEVVVSPSRFDRMLYYQYDRAWKNDLYLLSKPGGNRDKATLFGITVPALLIGGALVVLWLERASTDP